VAYPKADTSTISKKVTIYIKLFGCLFDRGRDRCAIGTGPTGLQRNPGYDDQPWTALELSSHNRAVFLNSIKAKNGHPQCNEMITDDEQLTICARLSSAVLQRDNSVRKHFEHRHKTYLMLLLE